MTLLVFITLYSKTEAAANGGNDGFQQEEYVDQEAAEFILSVYKTPYYERTVDNYRKKTGLIKYHTII